MSALTTHPTTTVLQSRVRLFQPVLRPKKIECDAARWQETAWGRCRVAGRLGQRHACLQNAILHTALGQHEESDGGITVLTDPYKLRVATGGGPQANYGGGVKRLIEDMINATIEIVAMPCGGRAGFSAAGHLIDHVVGVPTYMGREIPDPLHPGAARRFWAVRLGVCLAALLKHDLILYYNPEPIAALGHGISQAVARHVLSHKREPHGGWKLDRLIEVVGGPTGGQALRHRRQELRDDAAALRACGLLVRGDRVHKSSENVQQIPGGVPQIPGTVPQIPGAFSKSPVAAASSAPSGLG